MLITNLRDRTTRWPQVVVGGLGTGTTTLVVQLTKLLAERDAVPVPISLRDAQDSLDFRTLALHRFLEATSGVVTDDANAIRIWRQLCEEDKVVVLADGLEEALTEAGEARDYSIRLAVLQAAEQRLPLIITSRPHDPLRGMPASIVQLEQLSEEAMLEHLQQGKSEDSRRLAWIVETADLAETPNYLQITRQLDQMGLLDRPPTRDRRMLDTRLIDRADVRLHLLDSWVEALLDGYFAAEVALARDERAAIVEQLSVLACIGLQHDRLFVTFGDFRDLFTRGHPVIEEASRRLADLGSGFDIQGAALRGTQLGLIEAHGDGVLFRRPLLQAYLGSRLIGAAMEDPEYRSTAMRRPGREFLTALVMHSRASVHSPSPTESAGPAEPVEPPQARDWRSQDLLVEAASLRADPNVLDLYAAALQIDCVDQAPMHNRIAELLTRQWPEVRALEPRSLEEAKLNLVRRFAEVMRTVADRYPQGKQDSSAKGRRRERPDVRVLPAYRELYQISCLESSDSVRAAAAQEIGAGGDEALDVLEGFLGPPDDVGSPYGRTVPRAREEINGKTGDRSRSGNGTQKEDRVRKDLILRAWLAPLLAGSANGIRRDARDNLQRWLQFVGEPVPAQASYAPNPRLYLEVALAQGFKYAANRRLSHPQAGAENRFYLVEQASEMLSKSRFWFAQLTLLHALCLWELPDYGPSGPPDDGPVKRFERRRTDPDTVVLRWAHMLGGPQHPFVLETLRLVAWALDTGLPERFIWIDEKDVAAAIGSYPARLRSARKHSLWIPPSTGWAVLHPRAQRLLADVLLLLNLAERGQQADDYYGLRLQRINRNDLPPCLTANRGLLDPGRGGGPYRAPGSNCTAGCPFGLCPYPPKREVGFRTELSESFCLRQQTLIKSHLALRRTAPWQETTPARLRQFWEEMAQRSRK